MKRGTHGKVANRIVVVKVTSRKDNVRAAGIVYTTGTQPGVIRTNDSPKSTEYPRLFLKNLPQLSEARDARHGGY